MNSGPEKQRAIVYIDGYNLYYGMRQAYGKRYKWLDLQGLAGSFLNTETQLIGVKYFTAITQSTTGARQRQEVYLKALQAHCDKLEIFYGRFLTKPKRCRSCGAQHVAFEEKKTDVNIACEILNDTHLDRYDCCYVVSGASDLVPPLKIIRDHHPAKHTLVAHPPKRKSVELCKVANGWFAIGERKFKLNQLPSPLTTAHGNLITRPKEWQ
ncbi:MAG: NYN domain-containing protein [Sinobacteraceae bacterium]|nr:NYN domain-containing protein [Nevskiaceae bacterium]